MIFDAHLDLAWNALEWNRDLMQPVARIREFERQFTGIVPGDCTVSWPELQRGRVGAVIATLISRLRRKDKVLTFYRSREADYAASHGQLAYYRAMERRGVIRLIRNAAALDEHVTAWERVGQVSQPARDDSDGQVGKPTPPGRQPIGVILSMEGSQPILSPSQVPEWFDAGLRIVGPAHYGENPYCFGTGSEGGLKADGPALLKAMDRAGLLLDVTHLADRSFWEALDVFTGPVLASHHNCRTLAPGDRQLSDEQIKALIARDAVIGASFDNWMIVPDWKIGFSDPQTVSMEHIADHTDHICQLAGDARHCGIGSDLDGGFGKEQSPRDLDTIADLGRFGEILDRRGYSDEDIAGILYRNWVGFFRRAWSAM